MTLTRYEQETITSYVEGEQETTFRHNEDEKQADVCTTSPVMMRHMDKLCERYPDTYHCYRRDQYGASYKCPKDRVRVIPPVSEKRKEAGRRAGLKYGFKHGVDTAPDKCEAQGG